ncbi:hypothetical protein BRD13_05090 [Halobacteriales archaeon SW_5_70_135]|nr:MAG: hypothetical protein BRD13_05090 [Halobacteriales archaeon SW_5_70_135]
MNVRVRGAVPPAPFLSARDLLLTEHSLDHPVEVEVRDDPDERTWAAHYDDRHVLNVSRQAATSAMARELALHELAHMVRHEQGHPSHTQSTREALYLALAGQSVEKRRVTHCYQIANHMRDIYADDITLSVGPTDKLVAYLESSLAAAVADAPAPARPGGSWGSMPPLDPGATVTGDGTTPAGPASPPGGLLNGESVRPLTAGADPDITAVNAAFALALVERHDLVDDDHRLYDLAHAAASDAPGVSLAGFKRRFAALGDDPSESEFRKSLVETARAYVTAGDRAAD